MSLSSILNVIPQGLRDPLIQEYGIITQKYLEGKWRDSSLSGGLFCEIVYTIIDGYGSGTYSSTPSKPRNFVDACRRLENYSHVPRSFQILIPRMLPPLYEIRNNRSVGHVGGDVDPNYMDATAVVSNASWVMGELIRVLHNTTLIDAQGIVDKITGRKIPLVWNSGNLKRVLNTKISYPNQILILLVTESSKTDIDNLFVWLDYSNKTYFKKMLKDLHKKRYIEYSEDNNNVEILPPGTVEAEKIIQEL
jgi:hypothetical protein